jgi:hypothetical protein
MYGKPAMACLKCQVIQVYTAKDRDIFETFFGPQMPIAYRLDAISQGPKNLEFQGPTPSHLP